MWVTCLCDREDHDRLRPVAEDDVRAMIYVEIPMTATPNDVDRLIDSIGEVAASFPREGWDALVYASIRHPETEGPR